jgi:hypothetical protein
LRLDWTERSTVVRWRAERVVADSSPIRGSESTFHSGLLLTEFSTARDSRAHSSQSLESHKTA